jgi:hypothetical protein
LQGVVRDFQQTLQHGASERAVIPFNRKAEWGPDGRIAPDAPAYSPFIPHKPRLDFE